MNTPLDKKSTCTLDNSYTELKKNNYSSFETKVIIQKKWMICATSRPVLSNILPHFTDDYRNVSFLTLCHFFFQICIDPSLVWCVVSIDNQTVIRGFCVRYRQNYNYGKVLAGNVYRWLRSDSIKKNRDCMYMYYICDNGFSYFMCCFLVYISRANLYTHLSSSHGPFVH